MSVQLLCIGVFISFVFLISICVNTIRHILASTSYLSASSGLIVDNFPENSTTSGLPQGLANACGVRGSVMFLYLDGPLV
ncbi:hypothetical protein M405DRAFT_825043, partial [Rhizopogon salebrosus TDB-379]